MEYYINMKLILCFLPFYYLARCRMRSYLLKRFRVQNQVYSDKLRESGSAGTVVRIILSLTADIVLVLPYIETHCNAEYLQKAVLIFFSDPSVN
jgi:hypothetical protein